MRFSKWLSIFILTVIVTAAGFCGFNVVTDPFGVFGDHFFNWFSYDMTKNPRVAKITYLDRHYDEYDSYIIGCSKTGGIPIDELNDTYGGNFYSMLMYGGDMYDIEKTAEYIIANYPAKNIVIDLGLEEAAAYDTESDPMCGNLSYKVDGSSALAFYAKYLFANPSYGLDKTQSWFQKSYVQSDFNVFLAQSGTYDKRKRDSERVADLGSYDKANSAAFGDLAAVPSKRLTAMAQCVAAVKKIKTLCEEKGIRFTLIMDPVTDDELSTYDSGDLAQYWTELAEVTDFWDFNGHSVISQDHRYFYDSYHFRNCVGKMMLAKIRGDSDAYIPADFGAYVTAANVADRVEAAFQKPADSVDSHTYTAAVPILMYHYIGDDSSAGDSGVTSTANFEAQLAALREAGYHSVSFDDLIAYVDRGVDLPANPIVITFDDGYENNYTVAYPLLKKYGFVATVNVIGVSVGKDTYENTAIAITPHFSYAEAKEMVESGVISIESHGYDVHQVEKYSGSNCRSSALPLAGEDEDAYIRFFRNDCQKARAAIKSNLGTEADVYAYPNGKYSTLTEILLMEMGNRVTLTTNWGTNTIIKGLPQSLYAMNRYAIGNDLDAAALLKLLKGE